MAEQHLPDRHEESVTWRAEGTVGGPHQFLKGLEVLGHGVRRIRQPARGERVCLKEMRELFEFHRRGDGQRGKQRQANDDWVSAAIQIATRLCSASRPRRPSMRFGLG